jgi:hypothetical protein
MLFTLAASPCRADDADEAKKAAEAFMSCLDNENVQCAYRLVGEQWSRTSPKSEIIAGIQKWLATKGGAAPSHELVAQRMMTEDQAHAQWPTTTAKGNLYIFRYRSKYPNGTFFEDIYVNRESDGVLRIQSDTPQPG